MKKCRLLFLSSVILILVSVLSSITIFAEETDAWTLKASMNNARRLHQVAVVNGKIYAIGGYNSGPLNSVEEYDPATNVWTTKAPMANARYKHKLAVVGGKIYAICGYNSGTDPIASVEEYDPATNTWTTKAPIPNAKFEFQLAVVNNKIYVIGGYKPYGASSTLTKTVEEYDPATDTWTTKAPLSGERCYHRVCVLDGKIYVIGGEAIDYSLLNLMEEYDPLTNTWTTKPTMQYARKNHQVAVANGKIYAISGYGPGATSTEEYDPETNTWTSKAPMNNKRDFCEVEVINNKIYAIAGRNVDSQAGGDNISSVEEYDPATNTWTMKAPMTTIRSSSYPLQFDIAVVNCSIYAVGGCTTPDSPLGSVEMYTPGATSSEPNTEPGTEPEVTSNSGILEITMTNGIIKEYDLTSSELQNFLTWYDGRTDKEGKEYYIFNKKNNIKPFLSRKEYISYDKISSFEVKEYAE